MELCLTLCQVPGWPSDRLTIGQPLHADLWGPSGGYIAAV